MMYGFEGGSEGIGRRPGIFQEIYAYLSCLFGRRVRISFDALAISNEMRSMVAYLEVDVGMTYWCEEFYGWWLYWVGRWDDNIELPSTSYSFVSHPCKAVVFARAPTIW